MAAPINRPIRVSLSPNEPSIIIQVYRTRLSGQ
jgi:hypothetical protein